MTSYEQYLLQLQSELPKRMYLTLDERLKEHIELGSVEFDESLMVDAHLEIIKLRKALWDMVVIAETDNRVETGSVRFGGDWPGLFIRGDDCLRLMFLLKNAFDMVDPINEMFIHDLLDGIESATGQR